MRSFVMRLPLKPPSGMGYVWDMVKVETRSKDKPDQVLFDDFINMTNQCVYTFAYKKSILNVICKRGKWIQTWSSNFKGTS